MLSCTVLPQGIVELNTCYGRTWADHQSSLFFLRLHRVWSTALKHVTVILEKTSQKALQSLHFYVSCQINQVTLASINKLPSIVNHRYASHKTQMPQLFRCICFYWSWLWKLLFSSIKTIELQHFCDLFVLAGTNVFIGTQETAFCELSAAVGSFILGTNTSQTII